MSNQINISSLTRNPLSWMIMLTLTVLAWIPILQQTWGMLSTSAPQFGTMGLSLGPFLLFWTCMMAAMMFPALTPSVSVRYELLRQRTGRSQAIWQVLAFLPGYLLIWTLFGVPVFFLAWLGGQLVRDAPAVGIGLGIGLLVAVGLYQMTPLEKRYIMSCNPGLCCPAKPPSAGTFLAPVRDGLLHGMSCLGCCGGLMLVMVPVGLVNLLWMVLLTVLIFLEKTWQYGDRLGFFIGFGLLIFAALAVGEPALLPGLSRPLLVP
jgi:predicted metal-binding membrane protein